MTIAEENRAKKSVLIKKIYEYFSTYKSVVMVSLHNVSSNQVQQIRKDLVKAGAELVIGKNTVIATALKLRAAPLDKSHEEYEFFNRFGAPMPQLNVLKDHLVGKFGMVFSNLSVFDLKSIIASNRREAVAKVGVVSPVEVTIPTGSTGMDPSQITFFHALSITTKINKGMIEILKEVKVLKVGQVVGNSEAALLAKMQLKPFSYGMEVLKVYDDGVMLDKSIINFDLSQLLDAFHRGVKNITALSLESGIVTAPAVPHIIVNAFKNLAAISVETGYKLAALDAAQAAAKNAPAAPAAGSSQQKASVQEVKVEEKVEEEDVDMGGLFDDF